MSRAIFHNYNLLAGVLKMQPKMCTSFAVRHNYFLDKIEEKHYGITQF